MRTPKEEEQFRQYKVRYFDFIAAINGARAISIVAIDVLEDFPARLPKEAREKLHPFLREVGLALLAVSSEESVGAKASADAKKITVPNPGELGPVALHLLMANALSGGSSDYDFPYALRAQELAMLLAHMNAFLSDSLRAICFRQPSVLRRAKKITWAEILNCGAWEDVVALLVEEFAFEVGWHGIRKILEIFDQELGVAIGEREIYLKPLDHAEQVRHLVIHNGCRVNPLFKRKSGSTEDVGARVEITSDLINDCGQAVTMLGSAVFEIVARKFFAATESDLSGVLRPRSASP